MKPFLRKKRNMQLMATIKDGDVFDEVSGHILREYRGRIKEYKYCPVCKKWRTLDHFYNNKSSKADGLNTYCKDCSNKKSREYNALLRKPIEPENKEPQKEATSQATLEDANINSIPQRTYIHRSLHEKILPGDIFDFASGHLFRIVDGVKTELKYCSKCGEWHVLSDFGKKRRTLDGLQCQCKKCRNKSHREHYLKSTELNNNANTKEEVLSGLSETEIMETLVNSKVPVRILFKTIARLTDDRFAFYVYDKDLDMTIPIKTNEETNTRVMGA